MSVRKRTWKTSKGEQREAWVADYVDQEGKRHIETFDRKKDADEYRSKVNVSVKAGTHVAPSRSVTVREAGELWIASSSALGLERSTLSQYRQHLKLHIYPFIGGVKLSELSVPAARAFEDRLRLDRSTAMTRKIMGSLSSILTDAHERGLVAQNVIRDLRSRRRKGKEHQADKRQKGKLKVGVDFPTPDEIKRIIGHVKGCWRPLIITAIFTGLRASELRGLRWCDVDLKANELHVRQRADKFNTIGKPKSAAGERTVPFGKFVANTLREWKLVCPKSELDLVFPTASGKVQRLSAIVELGLCPAQVAAGITIESKAKYTGFHSLRHFYASWCINRPADGGLGLPPKVVQERLGHSSITMTYDTYGHLFPRGDDAKELDAAENALLA